MASSKKATFLLRLSSTIALWTVALATIFTGFEIGFFVLIAGLGLTALWEYFRMLDAKGLPNFKLFGIMCGAMFFGGSFYYFRTVGPSSSYDFEVLVLLVFLVGVFTRQMFQKTRDLMPLETMAYTVFGLLYVLWLFNFVTKIVYVVPRVDGAINGHFYVLYLVLVTKFSDMGAYVVGSMIGKNKLIPHISPAKTREGFVGGLAFSTLGSVGLFKLLPATCLPGMTMTHAIILGVLLGFVAVIGDLAESIVKRSTGVKDSGKFLPGIGGALDLIDSILFTAPLLYFYLHLVIGIS